jgi:hypothetical protein
MPQSNNVEQSLQNSIQNNFLKAPYTSPLSMLMLISSLGDVVSPWWSKRRDMELKSFMRTSDHISGAVYNFVSKMTAIPVRIEARDKSIKTHVEMAKTYQDLLNNASQFGAGWSELYGKFVEDLVTQDNGAFIEVIGPGDPTGPITGMPLSLANLDASRCNRTGNAVYPVIYEGMDGKLYKLHYTRVIFASQLPSSKLEMFGVGYCALSRCVNAAQNLIDISVYKQEKLGSRPPRQLIITGGGLDPEDLQLAVRMAEQTANNVGLSRFAKTVVAGNRNLEKPNAQIIELAKTPDGFDEKESTVLGMAVVSLAFGMDARELFPGMESGASKADALIQHLKQRGKGPGQTIDTTERLLDMKFLPPYLKSTFDYQDDAQDRQAADIWNVRAQARQRDLLQSVTNTRVERQKMVENGELTPEQFEELELDDGRLIDGISVEFLFKSGDKDYKTMLSGVSEGNYESKMQDIMEIVMTSKDQELIRKARRALAAIKYKFIDMPQKKMLEEARVQEAQNRAAGPQMRANQPTGNAQGASQGQGGGGKPNNDQSYQQERAGRKLGVERTRVDERQNQATKEELIDG